MAKNSDGTVTLKTTGKTGPKSGGGTPQRTPNVAAGSGSSGPKVVKQKGRGPVALKTGTRATEK